MIPLRTRLPHPVRLSLPLLVAPVAAHAQVAELAGRVGDTIDRWWTSTLFEVGGAPLSFASLVTLLAIVASAWAASVVVQRALTQLSQRPGVQGRAAYYAIGRLLHYVLIAIGVVIGLAAVGLDVGKVTLLVSAVGVGLGFGLQQIINNLVSGIILLFEQSLKVGDFVELESGVTGEVREINIRSTRITTNDNLDVLVPNSAFIGGQVTDWTLREASRRIRIPFGVAYGSDKDLVRRAVLEAAAEVPFLLETVDPARRPQVWLSGFGASSLDFELVIWVRPEAVKKPDAVRAAYNWAIESALNRHGIEIPFPQSDLHIRSAFGLDGERALAALGAKALDAARAPARPRAVATDGLSGNDAAHGALHEIAADASNRAKD